MVVEEVDFIVSDDFLLVAAGAVKHQVQLYTVCDSKSGNVFGEFSDLKVIPNNKQN